MPNKFHRQNLRMGSNPFGRKSNLAKIAEVFGPKKKDKKVKKPTKRMMANVGGSADEKRDIRKVEQMIGKTISSKREKGRMKANVGGKAKKKKKFPDMSGDGKVTMKDILMARGVIPKKKKTKKKVI
jgi:hypothetical protein